MPAGDCSEADFDPSPQLPGDTSITAAIMARLWSEDQERRGVMFRAGLDTEVKEDDTSAYDHGGYSTDDIDDLEELLQLHEAGESVTWPRGLNPTRTRQILLGRGAASVRKPPKRTRLAVSRAPLVPSHVRKPVDKRRTSAAVQPRVRKTVPCKGVWLHGGSSTNNEASVQSVPGGVGKRAVGQSVPAESGNETMGQSAHLLDELEDRKSESPEQSIGENGSAPVNGLTSQKRRRIETKRQEALLRRTAKLTAAEAAANNSAPAARCEQALPASVPESVPAPLLAPPPGPAPGPVHDATEPPLLVQQPTAEDPQGSLTAQQQRRIEINRHEAEQRRVRKRLAGKTTLEVQSSGTPHDPFGEFVDATLEDVPLDPNEPPHISVGMQGASSSSDSPKPDERPASRSTKHAISSAKLNQAKNQANETWAKHLGSSERVSQLMGTLPSMTDGSPSEVPKQRFKVHQSHVTVALRSIVHCKLCGYWASKKSQKLQDECQRMPPHSDGAHKLRRMLGGLHPEVKVKIWPDGHDARIPSQPIPVDWS